MRYSEMGLIRMPEEKAAPVFSQPERDDSDSEQSGTEAPIHEGRSDQNESSKLSSDCMKQLCLTQSMSFSNILDRIRVFDGSRINPLEEAFLVLDGTPKICEEDVLAGDVVAWLHNSLESEINDSSSTNIESTESSYESSLFEDSSVLNSSCSSHSTNGDSCSLVCDFDRADISASLLDLEAEDCEWVSDKMQGFDALPADFPSPSFNSKWNPHFKLSNYRSAFVEENSSADLLSERTSAAKGEFPCESNSRLDLEGFSADEPLFWPPDQKSDWHPEVDWCILSISPRRDIRNFERLFAKESASLRQPERKGSLLQKGPLKGGQILFESRSSASSLIRCKTKGRNSKVTVIGSMPSRLSHSSSCSSEQHSHCLSMKSSPDNMKENPSPISSVEVRPSHLQLQGSGEEELQLSRNTTSIDKMSIERQNETKNDQPDASSQPSSEMFAEVDQKIFLSGLHSNEEALIETLVGLNEFSGREGIDTQFDECMFYFDGL